MNVPTESIEFIKKLTQLSNEKKVNWHKRDDDFFILNRQDYKISILKWVDSDLETTFCSFSFTKGDSTNSINTSNEESGFELLEQLFDAASRNSQDIKRKMDSFLSEFE